MAIPFLNNITLNNNEIQNVKLHNTGTISSPAAGHIYFDTDDNIAKYYNGSAWIEIVASTGGTVTSVESGDTNTITIGGTATDPTVAANTAAVADGSANLATGDQIYDFVTGLGYVESVSGGTYLTNSGTATAVSLDHDDTSRTDTTSTDTPGFGGTFEAVTSVTTNAQGHVTAIDVSTVEIPASDNTDVDVSVANLITRLGQISEDVTIGDAADVTVIIPGDLQVTGTTTTNNVETVSTSNGVIFEGNAADANELTLLAGTLTSDRTITLPNATGTVALTDELHDEVTLAAGSYDYITLSGQELTLNQIDYTTDIANTPTIPSAANDATITLSAGNGLTGGGEFTTDQVSNETITVSHADTSSQASVDNSGVTVIQDVTLDTYGHVTALESVDLTSGINSLIDTKISATGYAATITDSVSGTTFNHGLGDDVIVQLYDAITKETVYADVERNGNYLNITFASTPTNSIRVLVQQIN
jgi:hypothetical protein